MRSEYLQLLIVVFTISLGFVCGLDHPLIGRRNPVAQTQIEKLLIDLQSSHESEVLAAKDELLRIGEGAVGQIASLLKQLKGYGGDKELHRELSAETRGRLETELVELLGRLHAVEAVPLLVAIMEEEEIDDMIQGMSPSMRALSEIGRSAVPELIRCLDGAKRRASEFPELQVSNLSEETRQRNLSWIKGRIELRAIMVLREIGDQRAIPALLRLETKADNQFIIAQARQASKEIQNRRDR